MLKKSIYAALIFGALVLFLHGTTDSQTRYKPVQDITNWNQNWQRTEYDSLAVTTTPQTLTLPANCFHVMLYPIGEDVLVKMSSNSTYWPKWLRIEEGFTVSLSGGAMTTIICRTQSGTAGLQIIQSVF